MRQSDSTLAIASWAMAFIWIMTCSCPTQAAESQVIWTSDFEQVSPAGLPPGWTMWGAQKYKDAANYTRDTQRPHGGQACFRIHHPSRTEGYVVSSPETAIRPKTGMMYTVTFWARSDRSGESVFGWEAYQQIRPFVDAPSPGYFPLHLGPEWTQCRFVLHEGWDFFAEECRYLLLSFKATARADEERTLWIDDVVVTEQPSTRKGRLVNPATLSYPRLVQRLQARQGSGDFGGCRQTIEKGASRRSVACRSIGWLAGQSYPSTDKVATFFPENWRRRSGRCTCR